MCSTSLGPIQPFEAVNKASLETLKSLASVFEISKLTEAITVIDKQAESWKSEPLWVRLVRLDLKSAHI